MNNTELIQKSKTSKECIDIINNLYGFSYDTIKWSVSYKSNYNNYTEEELIEICNYQLELEDLENN